MRVVDASVVVDAFVGTGRHADRARRELRQLPFLPVPSIFPAEVTSAIGGLLRRGALSARRATGALAQLRVLRTVEYPFAPFEVRVWELRDTLSVYDAWYVALAEQLGIELVTADRRLASASGPRCAILEPGG